MSLFFEEVNKSDISLERLTKKKKKKKKERHKLLISGVKQKISLQTLQTSQDRTKSYKQLCSLAAVLIAHHRLP